MKTITLHRFCSTAEYEALARGDTLTNLTNHRAAGRRSSAIGFCFTTDHPDRAIRYLKGTVDLDYCITLEAPATAVCLATARYADPDSFSPDIARSTVTTITRTEYCATRYGRDLGFRLIAATTQFRSVAPNHRDLVKLFPSIYGH